jgi:hypothetical protein
MHSNKLIEDTKKYFCQFQIPTSSAVCQMAAGTDDLTNQGLYNMTTEGEVCKVVWILSTPPKRELRN